MSFMSIKFNQMIYIIFYVSCVYLKISMFLIVFQHRCYICGVSKSIYVWRALTWRVLNRLLVACSD